MQVSNILVEESFHFTEDKPSMLQRSMDIDALDGIVDYCIRLYREHHANLKEAMDILSARLIKCSPDPEHVSELIFPFMYEEQVNGESIAKEKMVVCSPHLKLIRPNSNLRIYFEWCDRDVGKGEKVLIGRIGRHPY